MIEKTIQIYLVLLSIHIFGLFETSSIAFTDSFIRRNNRSCIVGESFHYVIIMCDFSCGVSVLFQDQIQGLL